MSVGDLELTADSDHWLDANKFGLGMCITDTCTATEEFYLWKNYTQREVQRNQNMGNNRMGGAQT